MSCSPVQAAVPRPPVAGTGTGALGPWGPGADVDKRPALGRLQAISGCRPREPVAAISGIDNLTLVAAAGGGDWDLDPSASGPSSGHIHHNMPHTCTPADRHRGTCKHPEHDEPCRAVSTRGGPGAQPACSQTNKQTPRNVAMLLGDATYMLGRKYRTCNGFN